MANIRDLQVMSPNTGSSGENPSTNIIDGVRTVATLEVAPLASSPDRSSAPVAGSVAIADGERSTPVAGSSVDSNTFAIRSRSNTGSGRSVDSGRSRSPLERARVSEPSVPPAAAHVSEPNTPRSDSARVGSVSREARLEAQVSDLRQQLSHTRQTEVQSMQAAEARLRESELRSADLMSIQRQKFQSEASTFELVAQQEMEAELAQSRTRSSKMLNSALNESYQLKNDALDAQMLSHLTESHEALRRQRDELDEKAQRVLREELSLAQSKFVAEYSSLKASCAERSSHQEAQISQLSTLLTTANTRLGEVSDQLAQRGAHDARASSELLASLNDANTERAEADRLRMDLASLRLQLSSYEARANSQLPGPQLLKLQQDNAKLKTEVMALESSSANSGYDLSAAKQEASSIQARLDSQTKLCQEWNQRNSDLTIKVANLESEVALSSSSTGPPLSVLKTITDLNEKVAHLESSSALSSSEINRKWLAKFSQQETEYVSQIQSLQCELRKEIENRDWYYEDNESQSAPVTGSQEPQVQISTPLVSPRDGAVDSINEQHNIALKAAQDAAAPSALTELKSHSKQHEADHVKILLPWPQPREFRKWWNHLHFVVASSHPLPEAVYQWFGDLLNSDSIESLADSGPFVTLDIKLATALKAQVQGKLNKAIELQEERTRKSGKMIKGRQVALMIWQSFRETEIARSLVDRQALQKLELRGQDLSGFYHQWLLTLERISLEDTPDERDLEHFFYTQISKAHTMQKCIEHYHHQLAHTPEFKRSYAYLLKSVEIQLEYNRAHFVDSDLPGGKKPNATPAQKGQGKGKPDAKAKAKPKAKAKKTSKTKVKGAEDCPTGCCPYHWTKGYCTRKEIDCQYIHNRIKPGVSPPSAPHKGGGSSGKGRDRTKSPADKRKPSPRPKSPSGGNPSNRNKYGQPTTGRSPSGKANAALCQSFMQCKCTKVDCDYWHPGKCKEFASSGSCSAGDNCSFQHDKTYPAAAVSAKAKAKAAAKGKATAKPKAKGKNLGGLVFGLVSAIMCMMPAPSESILLPDNLSGLSFPGLQHSRDLSPSNNYSLPAPLKSRRVTFDKRAENAAKKHLASPSLNKLSCRETGEILVKSPDKPGDIRQDSWKARESAWNLRKLLANYGCCRLLGKKLFFVQPDDYLPSVCSKPPYIPCGSKRGSMFHHRSHKPEEDRSPPLPQVRDSWYENAESRKYPFPRTNFTFPVHRQTKVWIADSGASFHMLDKSLLNRKERRTIRQGEPIQVQTATEVVTIDQVCEVHIAFLGITVSAYLLENCPPLLSVGRLVDELGFTFCWGPGSPPYFSKDNLRMLCAPHNHVPFVESACTSASIQVKDPSYVLADVEIPIEWEFPEESEEFSSVPPVPSPSVAARPPRNKGNKDTLDVISSMKHNIFTHFPKDTTGKCPVCNETKCQRAPARRKLKAEADDLPAPKQWADALTADHKILNEFDSSRERDQAALIILDRYTQWLQGFPCKQKSSEEIRYCFKRFLGPQDSAKHVFTDNAAEFISAMKELKFPHDTSRTHRSESNGVAERAVRKVKEGTSSVLFQSGLDDKWWGWAMTCYCFLHNVSDALQDGQTPYKRRFGEDFRGPLIPFGAHVHYLPSREDDQRATHQFNGKRLDGIFLGYKQNAGGGWEGDTVYVLDWDEVENAEALHQIYERDIHIKEVSALKVDGRFSFPLAEGKLRQPGSFRPKRQRRRYLPADPDTTDYPESGAEPLQEFSDAESESVEALPPEDKDYWTLVEDNLVRHHVTPRNKMFVPSQEDCPVPLDYLDISRCTRSDLESKKEKEIFDLWTEDISSRPLSENWTGKTSFRLLKPELPPNQYWCNGRPTVKKETTRPEIVWVEIWRDWSKKQRKDCIAQWEKERPSYEASWAKRKYPKDIPEEEVENYEKIIAEVRTRLSPPAAPAMPTVSYSASSILSRASNMPAQGVDGRPKIKTKTNRAHRDRLSKAFVASPEYFSLVHTPLSIPEAMKIPKAKQALNDEWQALFELKAFDFASVQPKHKVIADARKNGTKVHFGGIMELCSEKHSELPPEKRKYKGRVVFRGDQVKDETGSFAVFTEQGTSASHLEAAKILDSIARFPGFNGEDCDAVKAYTQVTLKDLHDMLGKRGAISMEYVETWVSLPPSRRPPSWRSIDNPVCILRRNLYGHPLAGLYWEIFCHDIVQQHGFQKVKGWECLFMNPAEKMFLSIYVDDFKLAGPAAKLPDMWSRLSGGGLKLEDPTPLDGNVYLGCNQHEFTPTESEIKAKSDLYNELFSVGCGGCESDDKIVDTTRMRESKAKNDTQESHPAVTSKKSSKRGRACTSSLPKIRGWYYEMSGHTRQCVERYLELSGKKESSLKPVATPCLDDQMFAPEDWETKGELTPIAARVVLKALYTARIGRADFLWTVNSLARDVTRWTVACDKRLHRLICYMKFSADWVSSCWLGDNPEDIRIALFVDASFAGDLRDSKSTTGAFIALFGPRTWVPITWMCKKQGAVSHSSTEAEVIALDAAVRLEGLPCLLFWEDVLKTVCDKQTLKPSLDRVRRKNKRNRQNGTSLSAGVAPCQAWENQILSNVDFVPCNLPRSQGLASLMIFEDNDAVIKMILKGRSNTLRHVPRTHRIDLDWLFERIREDPGVKMKFISTKQQIADVLTKGTFTQIQWKILNELAGIGPRFKSAQEKLKTPCGSLCVKKPEIISTSHRCHHSSSLVYTKSPTHCFAAVSRVPSQLFPVRVSSCFVAMQRAPHLGQGYGAAPKPTKVGSAPYESKESNPEKWPALQDTKGLSPSKSPRQQVDPFSIVKPLVRPSDEHLWADHHYVVSTEYFWYHTDWPLHIVLTKPFYKYSQEWQTVFAGIQQLDGNMPSERLSLSHGLMELQAFLIHCDPMSPNQIDTRRFDYQHLRSAVQKLLSKCTDGVNDDIINQIVSLAEFTRAQTKREMQSLPSSSQKHAIRYCSPGREVLSPWEQVEMSEFAKQYKVPYRPSDANAPDDSMLVAMSMRPEKWDLSSLPAKPAHDLTFPVALPRCPLPPQAEQHATYVNGRYGIGFDMWELHSSPVSVEEIHLLVLYEAMQSEINYNAHGRFLPAFFVDLTYTAGPIVRMYHAHHNSFRRWVRENYTGNPAYYTHVPSEVRSTYRHRIHWPSHVPFPFSNPLAYECVLEGSIRVSQEILLHGFEPCAHQYSAYGFQQLQYLIQRELKEKEVPLPCPAQWLRYRCLYRVFKDWDRDLSASVCARPLELFYKLYWNRLDLLYRTRGTSAPLLAWPSTHVRPKCTAADHARYARGIKVKPSMMVLPQLPKVEESVSSLADVPAASESVTASAPVTGSLAPGYGGHEGHTPGPAIADTQAPIAGSDCSIQELFAWLQSQIKSGNSPSDMMGGQSSSSSGGGLPSNIAQVVSNVSQALASGGTASLGRLPTGDGNQVTNEQPSLTDKTLLHAKGANEHCAQCLALLLQATMLLAVRMGSECRATVEWLGIHGSTAELSTLKRVILRMLRFAHDNGVSRLDKRISQLHLDFVFNEADDASFIALLPFVLHSENPVFSLFASSDSTLNLGSNSAGWDDAAARRFQSWASETLSTVGQSAPVAGSPPKKGMFTSVTCHCEAGTTGVEIFKGYTDHLEAKGLTTANDNFGVYVELWGFNDVFPDQGGLRGRGSFENMIGPQRWQDIPRHLQQLEQCCHAGVTQWGANYWPIQHFPQRCAEANHFWNDSSVPNFNPEIFFHGMDFRNSMHFKGDEKEYKLLYQALTDFAVLTSVNSMLRNVDPNKFTGSIFDAIGHSLNVPRIVARAFEITREFAQVITGGFNSNNFWYLRQGSNFKASAVNPDLRMLVFSRIAGWVHPPTIRSVILSFPEGDQFPRLLQTSVPLHIDASGPNPSETYGPLPCGQTADLLEVGCFVASGEVPVICGRIHSEGRNDVWITLSKGSSRFCHLLGYRDDDGNLLSMDRIESTARTAIRDVMLGNRWNRRQASAPEEPQPSSSSSHLALVPMPKRDPPPPPAQKASSLRTSAPVTRGKVASRGPRVKALPVLPGLPQITTMRSCGLHELLPRFHESAEGWHLVVPATLETLNNFRRFQGAAESLSHSLSGILRHRFTARGLTDAEGGAQVADVMQAVNDPLRVFPMGERLFALLTLLQLCGDRKARFQYYQQLSNVGNMTVARLAAIGGHTAMTLSLIGRGFVTLHEEADFAFHVTTQDCIDSIWEGGVRVREFSRREDGAPRHSSYWSILKPGTQPSIPEDPHFEHRRANGMVDCILLEPYNQLRRNFCNNDIVVVAKVRRCKEEFGVLFHQDGSKALQNFENVPSCCLQEIFNAFTGVNIKGSRPPCNYAGQSVARGRYTLLEDQRHDAPHPPVRVPEATLVSPPPIVTRTDSLPTNKPMPVAKAKTVAKASDPWVFVPREPDGDEWYSSHRPPPPQSAVASVSSAPVTGSPTGISSTGPIPSAPLAGSSAVAGRVESRRIKSPPPRKPPPPTGGLGRFASTYAKNMARNLSPLPKKPPPSKPTVQAAARRRTDGTPPSKKPPPETPTLRSIATSADELRALGLTQVAASLDTVVREELGRGSSGASGSGYWPGSLALRGVSENQAIEIAVNRSLGFASDGRARTVPVNRRQSYFTNEPHAEPEQGVGEISEPTAPPREFIAGLRVDTPPPDVAAKAYQGSDRASSGSDIAPEPDMEPAEPFDLIAARQSLETLWTQHLYPCSAIVLLAARVYENARIQFQSAPDVFEILPQEVANALGPQLEQVSRETAAEHSAAVVANEEFESRLAEMADAINISLSSIAQDPSTLTGDTEMQTEDNVTPEQWPALQDEPMPSAESPTDDPPLLQEASERQSESPPFTGEAPEVPEPTIDVSGILPAFNVEIARSPPPLTQRHSSNNHDPFANMTFDEDIGVWNAVCPSCHLCNTSHARLCISCGSILNLVTQEIVDRTFMWAANSAGFPLPDTSIGEAWERKARLTFSEGGKNTGTYTSNVTRKARKWRTDCQFKCLTSSMVRGYVEAHNQSWLRQCNEAKLKIPHLQVLQLYAQLPVFELRNNQAQRESRTAAGPYNISHNTCRMLCSCGHPWRWTDYTGIHVEDIPWNERVCAHCGDWIEPFGTGNNTYWETHLPRGGPVAKCEECATYMCVNCLRTGPSVIDVRTSLAQLNNEAHRILHREIRPSVLPKAREELPPNDATRTRMALTKATFNAASAKAKGTTYAPKVSSQIAQTYAALNTGTLQSPLHPPPLQVASPVPSSSATNDSASVQPISAARVLFDALGGQAPVTPPSPYLNQAMIDVRASLESDVAPRRHRREVPAPPRRNNDFRTASENEYCYFAGELPHVHWFTTPGTPDHLQTRPHILDQIKVEEAILAYRRDHAGRGAYAQWSRHMRGPYAYYPRPVDGFGNFLRIEEQHRHMLTTSLAISDRVLEAWIFEEDFWPDEDKLVRNDQVDRDYYYQGNRIANVLRDVQYDWSR